MDNYENECKWHIRCGPGEFMQGQMPSARGTCAKCPTDTYMHLFNHRETQCAAQPECAPGQGMSRDTKLAKRGCVDCDRGKSQNSEVHLLHGEIPPRRFDVKGRASAPKPSNQAGATSSRSCQESRVRCIRAEALSYSPGPSHSAVKCRV